MEQANLLLYTDQPRMAGLLGKRTETNLHCKCILFVANSLPEFLLLAKEQSITTGLIFLSDDDTDHLSKILNTPFNFPLIKIISGESHEEGFAALNHGFHDFLFENQINSFYFEKAVLKASVQNSRFRQYLEKESRYRRMFENSNIGIYLSTAEGKLLEVNAAFARMFGYSSPEAAVKEIEHTGKQLYIYPEDREKLINELRGNEAGYHRVELKLRKKNGKAFYGLLNMRRMKQPKGAPMMVEGFVQDITEKKALSNQIKETLLFLREILDNIPGPVFSKDLNFRYTGCNKEFEKYIGFTEKEILGKKLLELRDDELARFAHTKDLELLATGQEQKFEHRITFADGSVRDAIFHKNIFRNRKGEVSGIIGLILDATEEKQLLSQLKEELSLNKAITELSKELLKPGTSIADISNRVVDFAKDITGSAFGFAGIVSAKTGNLEINSTPQNFPFSYVLTQNQDTTDKTDDNFSAVLRASLNSLQPFYHNHPVINTDAANASEAKLTNLLSVPAKINGKWVGQLMLSNATDDYTQKDVDDVTKLTHLFSLAIQKQSSVDDLIAAKEKAEESDELKSAFLANMSHEIRTPLNAIVGFAQLLGDPNISNEEINDFKATIINNTGILLRLINDIIEMAMIEAGELKIHLEERKIKDLIDNIYLTWTSRDEYLETADRINFILEKPEEDEDVKIMTDSLRFSQVFDNLLMNAFRFTQNGQVTLGYRYPGNHKVEFYVKDTGVGIAPEFIKTIFDRFRQADELKVRSFSGTGLGLAITKKFIEHLSGEIRVDSTVGEGSCFSIVFSLPNVEAQKKSNIITEQKTPASAGSEESKIKSKAILIVEDNDANYEYLEVLLLKKGAKVQRAVDGKLAIELVVKRNFDIILMDLQLPRLSGFDAIKGIREINRDIPIIVQTAFSHSDERRKAFEAGCDAYLIKPLTSKKLIKTILQFC
jgi:PAS domain S-box-containing protein